MSRIGEIASNDFTFLDLSQSPIGWTPRAKRDLANGRVSGFLASPK
jgi:hypothetical protein